MLSNQALSRRSFLAATSCFGAAVAFAKLLPLPALGEDLAQDSRIAQTPLVDKGFASVRKMGNGVYATISDFSKGAQTICNGGFLIGRDAALLIEGFASPAGAGFQMDTLRTLSQVPVRAALDTHYHFDHSLGNAFYGAQNIPVWAHARVAPRIIESYVPLQGMERDKALAPFEKRVQSAKNETERQRAQSDVNAATAVWSLANGTVLALQPPARPREAPRDDGSRRRLRCPRDLPRPLRHRRHRPCPRPEHRLYRRLALQRLVSGHLRRLHFRLARDAREVRCIRQRHSVRSRPRPALRSGRHRPFALGLRRPRRARGENVQGRRPRRGSCPAVRRPRKIQEFSDFRLGLHRRPHYRQALRGMERWAPVDPWQDLNAHLCSLARAKL